MPPPLPAAVLPLIVVLMSVKLVPVAVVLIAPPSAADCIAGERRVDDGQGAVVENAATITRAVAGDGQTDNGRSLARVDIEDAA